MGDRVSENMGTAAKLLMLDDVARMIVVQNAADLSAFATLPGAAGIRSSLLVEVHIRSSLSALQQPGDKATPSYCRFKLRT